MIERDHRVHVFENGNQMTYVPASVAQSDDPVDVFRRVLAINEPLDLPDDMPLKNCLPEVWVSIGDLRRLIAHIDHKT